MEQLMKGKILLAVGLGVGYVLGTRAGRARYEQMKQAVAAVWNDPRVQKQVNNAEEFVKDKAPDVAEFLAEQAKRVVSQSGGAKKASAPTASTSASASTSTKAAPAARPASASTPATASGSSASAAPSNTAAKPATGSTPAKTDPAK